MSMLLITALIFLGALGLLTSAFYFFVEIPASRRALRSRLAAIHQLSASNGISMEADLLRKDVLSNIPVLNRFLLSFPVTVRLNLFLEQAAVEITAGFLLTIALFLICVAFLTCLLLSVPLLLCFPAAAAAGALPFMAIAIKRRRRFDKFAEQFPNALDLLARAVRAGHAFTTGIELVANEMEEPLAAEFRHVYEQQNLGLPIKEALSNMLTRIPLPDVHVFVTALVIQRETGGNLAEIIDSLAHVIRERFKLIRQIRVLTAQGRMSLYMLMALPPLMAVALFILNRPYIARLYQDPLGQRAILAAIVLQIVGFLVIRKIIQFRS